MTTPRTKALTKAQLDYALTKLRLYHKKAVEKFVADTAEKHGYYQMDEVTRGTNRAILSRMRGGKVTLTLKPEWLKYAKQNPDERVCLGMAFVECSTDGCSVEGLVRKRHKAELDELKAQFVRAEEELHLGDQALALALLRELEVLA